MKKYFKRIIPILIIIIVVSLIFAIKMLRTPVGIIDNIYYDMTPAGLKKVLGEPQSITDNRNLSAETIYDYIVDVNGHPTEMSFTFLHDKKLIAVHASVDAENPTDAGKIFEHWQSKLYAAYQDEKGFYCDEMQKTSDTDYEVALGTHHGATGVYCTISVEESAARLTCINMK